jgi:hypothetical protein
MLTLTIRSQDLLNLLDPKMIEGLDMLKGLEATLSTRNKTQSAENLSLIVRLST